MESLQKTTKNKKRNCRNNISDWRQNKSSEILVTKETIEEQEELLWEFWRQNKDILKSMKNTIEEQEEKLLEQGQQIKLLGSWYNQVKEQCMKKDEQLHQRELEMEELAKTVEYLFRLNKREQHEEVEDDFMDTVGHQVGDSCEASDFYWEDEF